MLMICYLFVPLSEVCRPCWMCVSLLLICLSFNAYKSHCVAIGKLSKLVSEPMSLGVCPDILGHLCQMPWYHTYGWQVLGF